MTTSSELRHPSRRCARCVPTCLVALLLGACGSAPPPVAPPAPPPADTVGFELPSDAGSLVPVPQPSSPFTIVDAFGPTCEPCREKVPALLARRDLLAGKGAKIVLVAVLGEGETTEQAAAALNSWGAPAPFLVDRGGVLAREMGLKGLPSTYLIDGEGRVRWAGGGSATADDVAAAVDAAAGR